MSQRRPGIFRATIETDEAAALESESQSRGGGGGGGGSLSDDIQTVQDGSTTGSTAFTSSSTTPSPSSKGIGPFMAPIDPMNQPPTTSTPVFITTQFVAKPTVPPPLLVSVRPAVVAATVATTAAQLDVAMAPSATFDNLGLASTSASWSGDAAEEEERLLHLLATVQDDHPTPLAESLTRDALIPTVHGPNETMPQSTLDTPSNDNDPLPLPALLAHHPSLNVSSGTGYLADPETETTDSAPVRHVVRNTRLHDEDDDDDANTTLGFRTVSTMSTTTFHQTAAAAAAAPPNTSNGDGGGLNKSIETGPHLLQSSLNRNVPHSNGSTHNQPPHQRHSSSPAATIFVPRRHDNDTVGSGYSAKGDTSRNSSSKNIKHQYSPEEAASFLGGMYDGNFPTETPCLKQNVATRVEPLSLFRAGPDTMESSELLPNDPSATVPATNRGGEARTVTNKTSLSYMQMMAQAQRPPDRTVTDDDDRRIVDLDMTLSDSNTTLHSATHSSAAAFPLSNLATLQSSGVGSSAQDIVTIPSSTLYSENSSSHHDYGDVDQDEDDPRQVVEVDQAMRRGTSMAYRADHSVMGTKDEHTIDTGSHKDFLLSSGSPLPLSSSNSRDINYDFDEWEANLRPSSSDHDRSNGRPPVDDTQTIKTMRKRRCCLIWLVLCLILLILTAITGGTVCMLTSVCRGISSAKSSPSQQRAVDSSSSSSSSSSSGAGGPVSNDTKTGERSDQQPSRNQTAQFGTTTAPSMSPSLIGPLRRPTSSTPTGVPSNLTLSTDAPTTAPHAVNSTRTVAPSAQPATLSDQPVSRLVDTKSPATDKPASSETSSPVATAAAAPEPTDSPVTQPAPTRAVAPLVLTTTQALYDAVDLYLAGSSTVPAIGEWNVGAITDFSSVFSAERNPAAKFFTVGDELNQWDTSNAISMKSMVRLSTMKADGSLYFSLSDWVFLHSLLTVFSGRIVQWGYIQLGYQQCARYVWHGACKLRRPRFGDDVHHPNVVPVLVLVGISLQQ
jgi:hypothetical protein